MTRALVRAVVVAIPLTLLGYAARTHFGPVIEFDENAIRQATAVTRTHQEFRQALIVWQEAFQPWRVHLVATLLCVVLWRRYGLRGRAAWAFATMMVAWFVALMLKLGVQRARPLVPEPVAHAEGYSFPSGHAANVTAAACILVIAFWPVLPRTGRWMAVGAATAVVTLTALDRVYLGVHYPTDVLAGIIFGSGIAAVAHRGVRDWNARDSQ